MSEYTFNVIAAGWWGLAAFLFSVVLVFLLSFSPEFEDADIDTKKVVQVIGIITLIGTLGGLLFG